MLLSLIAIAALELSAQMLVGSYNIRYKNDGDSAHVGGAVEVTMRLMCAP